MKYRIEISTIAEADNAFMRLSQVTSPTEASQWYAGLLQAIESLSQKMNYSCQRKPRNRKRKFNLNTISECNILSNIKFIG
ncbi:hypothetical protein Cylst_0215 [Cylindrospermum stagnale PCC 7417]|uniref:Uncharacterized protein n=1 Tax=Cylindrospermum stagnale PCC 7417 TaxID=56107 RepID=K9WQF5_9NOST|nr:hypothetical protein [Cylindrospermum stagnale]AFZ22590.1 hypothetical protein Cylst_0215 [Cylindrospermum stagnale PCC 7417]